MVVIPFRLESRYESLIVGVFTIYRCKGGPSPGNKYNALQCPNKGPDGADLRNHSEYDSIFLGFSRDASTSAGRERANRGRRVGTTSHRIIGEY